MRTRSKVKAGENENNIVVVGFMCESCYDPEDNRRVKMIELSYRGSSLAVGFGENSNEIILWTFELIMVKIV